MVVLAAEWEHRTPDERVPDSPKSPAKGTEQAAAADGQGLSARDRARSSELHAYNHKAALTGTDDVMLTKGGPPELPRLGSWPAIGRALALPRISDSSPRLGSPTYT
ncbi:hypothetical protein Ato02nite_074100 [Paractinoplanes toevensis]|uniref:Uncharacterized protein n=1 Tax=Paractinoplanes toevensis TaxID=571911 RepID=A0A919THT6_9ACTN|nr:hypothetical protein Ato02nite_074100 [Actinoplanes toevensis]